MRSLLLLSCLGIFALLVVCYSFWVATGVMQFAGMLTIIVIAFSRPGRNSASSNYVVLTSEDKTDPSTESQLV